MSEIDKLERLKKLLDDGAITEQEYNLEKNKLLSKKVSNTTRSISILLVTAFAFAGIYFLTSEKQEIPVLEAETIGTTTTTEPLQELIIDDSLVVDSIDDVISATVFISVQGIFTDINAKTLNSVEYQFSSSGSGFLISSNGYIVTNQHVVSGASIVEVYFADNETPKIAKVIATSECSDLALLKIDVQDRIYFEWASEKPRVGTEIYAAGYPLSDREFTLLDGIITKKDADGETPWASVESIFEHNAEIKPGNSGGPLLGQDAYKVYGVNFALESDDRGIGTEEFAINVDTAKNIVNSMLDGSHMSGFGINGQQIMNFGLFLESVDLGSPLDIAGLKGGDIITKLAGINLVDKSTLKTYCDILSTQTNSGKVLIEYFRIEDGKSYSTILNNDAVNSSVEASDTTTTTLSTTTTTTTTLAPTTTTSTTTTSTTVPFTSYKTYTLRALDMFLEVGFSKDNQVTRLNPSDGTLFISTNGNEDEGLDNYVKTLPSLFNELDLNINFEYINNDSSFNIDEIEIWFTNDGFTSELLEADTCKGSRPFTYKTKWDYSNQRWNRKAAQLNLCTGGTGFSAKKARLLHGLTELLGFIEFEFTSEYAKYGGFLEKREKFNQVWNEDDKVLIQILYDPRVYEGMTKEEFKEVFKLP